MKAAQLYAYDKEMKVELKIETVIREYPINSVIGLLFGRKKIMGETTQPKLRVSKKDAREKINNQTIKGRALCNDAIRLLSTRSFGDKEDKFRSIIELSKRWSRDNEVLLGHLFNSTVVSKDDYTKFYAPQDKSQTIEEMIRGVKNTPDLMDRISNYTESMESSINSLEGICGRLHLYDRVSEVSQHSSTNKDVSDNPSPSSTKHDVFIVHGRDDGAKETVARFVESDLGMNAIILHEQPSRGETIIEKIERYSDDVFFAIVLITPDDVGGLGGEADDERNPRPRQNVVFELGYFMGKLGRERVCPLFKGKAESPSDIDGIVYIDMDALGAWKVELRREISAVIEAVPSE